MKNITNGSINYSEDSGYFEKETFYLNHSCDEWIIGDLESAKKFAEDLLKTIKEVESNKCLGGAEVEIGGVCHRPNNPCYVIESVSQSVEGWEEFVISLTNEILALYEAELPPEKQKNIDSQVDKILKSFLTTFAEKIREEIRSTIISIPKTHTTDDCVVIKDEDYDSLLTQLKKI